MHQRRQVVTLELMVREVSPTLDLVLLAQVEQMALRERHMMQMRTVGMLQLELVGKEIQLQRLNFVELQITHCLRLTAALAALPLAPMEVMRVALEAEAEAEAMQTVQLQSAQAVEVILAEVTAPMIRP
jgi:hypothetical protein